MRVKRLSGYNESGGRGRSDADRRIATGRSRGMLFAEGWIGAKSHARTGTRGARAMRRACDFYASALGVSCRAAHFSLVRSRDSWVSRLRAWSIMRIANRHDL